MIIFNLIFVTVERNITKPIDDFGYVSFSLYPIYRTRYISFFDPPISRYFTRRFIVSFFIENYSVKHAAHKSNFSVNNRKT